MNRFRITTIFLLALGSLAGRSLAQQGAGASPAPSNAALASPSTGPLAERIQKIIDRPEFRHAMWGIEIYSLDTHTPVYRLNADKLFIPGSVTKVFTMGTALLLLGPDYRFHTRVYRTGDVSADGTLNGDLVLVASGDPNLSGRLRPDGTLAFMDEDHSYGGSVDTRAVPGDPLAVLRDLAHQVAANHITKINGRVLVDISLFPEGDRELGTGVVISPIVVNDNVIDVNVAPGPSLGSPATLKIDPMTSYVKFVNKVTTGPTDSFPGVSFSNDVPSPDGGHTVTVSGTIPAGKPPVLYSYAVPEPSRFAQVAFSEALASEGVSSPLKPGVDVKMILIPRSDSADYKALAKSYNPGRLLAEHISAPESEEVKVTLKVSQNLHASMTPYVLAAVLAHSDSLQAGFDLERVFLQGAGLDLAGALQADGAGGAALFTPSFVVQYLTFMSAQKSYADFFRALPILGKDGTLAKIQVESPAAGQVHAKTGTFGTDDLLNRRGMITGKGLAGYTTTADGRKLAFAIFANNVAISHDPNAANEVVGQALGAVAAAAYELKPQ
jgi:D-alanyl-D-alanine carboxypeptidase/D-alanyl-D-alanine-endopeptidase (penicillin-binding protein 4)